MSALDPKALLKTYCGVEFAGVMELDPRRMAENGAGWVSLVYVAPKFRGRSFSLQLMGHAISYYRTLGRKSLRLHVAETNEKALSLYDSMGFHCIEKTQGNVAMLRMLEKEI